MENTKKLEQNSQPEQARKYVLMRVLFVLGLIQITGLVALFTTGERFAVFASLFYLVYFPLLIIFGVVVWILFRKYGLRNQKGVFIKILLVLFALYNISYPLSLVGLNYNEWQKTKRDKLAATLQMNFEARLRNDAFLRNYVTDSDGEESAESTKSKHYVLVSFKYNKNLDDGLFVVFLKEQTPQSIQDRFPDTFEGHPVHLEVIKNTKMDRVMYSFRSSVIGDTKIEPYLAVSEFGNVVARAWLLDACQNHPLRDYAVPDFSSLEPRNFAIPESYKYGHVYPQDALLVYLKKNTPKAVRDFIPLSYENFPVCIKISPDFL
ncbi:MAG: hypothetical protein AAB420_02065 [Patescibacteria group bacterium]